MFDTVGWGEITVLLLLALFIFGPERLPTMAAEAGRGLRRLRGYVKGMTDDLKAELGPEVGDLDLASLHPKTFVRKHLLDDDPDDYLDRLSGSPAVARGGVPLEPGEVPPWDPDTT